MISDCTLKTRTKSRIESRISDSGASFQECQQNCIAAFERRGKRQTRPRTIKPKSSTSRTSTGRTRKTSRTRTRNDTKTITSEDAGNCDCYCSMIHDPCLDVSTPITGDYI